MTPPLMPPTMPPMAKMDTVTDQTSDTIDSVMNLPVRARYTSAMKFSRIWLGKGRKEEIGGEQATVDAKMKEE
ncbi:hypothetical protein TYRP_016492 [Tyrophagus putrescentiae]|nr:hypothetical protein TYRP_016492 [Tyrophagus putrescentiae]